MFHGLVGLSRNLNMHTCRVLVLFHQILQRFRIAVLNSLNFSDPFFGPMLRESSHPETGSSRPNVATHSWDPSSQPFQVLLGVGWRHRDAPQIRLASVMISHLYLS